MDTSEVRMAGPRKLHAAWAEVHNRKVLLPPTVCIELAWEAVPPDAVNGISQAEHRLRNEDIDIQTELRLEKQAWWANVWRDASSPYEAIELTPDQEKLKTEIAEQMTAECFNNAAGHNIPEHRDTLIIAETLAVGGKLLLTSNIRSIKHDVVNEWTTKNGKKVGFKPQPVLYPADPSFLEWTNKDEELKLWTHAGLIACWPQNDDAPANEVVKKTLNNLKKFTQKRGGPLRGSAKRLIRALERNPKQMDLVEETRQHLPSPTIATDRQHPTFPERPSAETARQRYRNAPKRKPWTPLR
ncbi:MAG: hypothetical protein OXG35_21430 [Acidobacteria bacterium]|nr:hypothetical protein [Acidobacteriota bacterium]